jgi:hypothetical protein
LRETGDVSLYQRHGKTTDNCNKTSARIYTACPALSLSHSPIATMVHCKIALGGALRRFSVADGETDGTHAPPLTLAALRTALATLDASAAAPGALSFLDSDGDACALLSDADLREALAVSPVLLRLRFEPGGTGAPPAAAAKALGIVAKGGGGGGAVAARVKGPGHPLPLFKAVAPRAVDEKVYREKLAAVGNGVLGFKEGVNGRAVCRKACMQVRWFVLHQKMLRGDIDASAAIPEERVYRIVSRVSTTLEEAGVSVDGVAAVQELVKAALEDSGTRTALFDAVENDGDMGFVGPKDGPRGKVGKMSCKKVAGRVGANMSPLQFVVNAAKTELARASAQEARKIMCDSSGARKLLAGVRPAIHRATFRFVRQKVKNEEGAPLKSDEALAEYAAEIKAIVAEAGLSAENAGVIEGFAAAMAADAGARAAALRIIDKRMERIAATQAEGKDVEAAADVAGEGTDVSMVAEGVASVSFADEKTV